MFEHQATDRATPVSEIDRRRIRRLLESWLVSWAYGTFTRTDAVSTP
jgi:hypothetical protein